ncbi:MAG TPA: hypothetical protein VFE17_13375 [Candidatus Baltobacteraceae bacterium]|nr:hypothetical protein [Candidatus Baltobacteraceae bacterium]
MRALPVDFTFDSELSVQPPYRLDLTVQALRRVQPNIVDVLDDDNVYRRALVDETGTNLVEVRQSAPDKLTLRLSGSRPGRWVPTVARMLGVYVNLDEWYRRASAIPAVAQLSAEMRGLRPPQYPFLWEALSHAIVFQQLSLHAAGTIMRRFVQGLSRPLTDGDRLYYPFVTPQAVLKAPDATLRSFGLSAAKVGHLRTAATAILGHSIDEGMIESLDSLQASALLMNLRGIGPWSASLVLLRGFGRLDVFPLKDSGVARSVAMLSTSYEVKMNEALEALGPVQGMLYFHLLLGRIRRKRGAPSRPE